MTSGRDGLTSSTSQTRSHRRALITESTIFLITAVLLTALPFLTLMIWLPITVQRGNKINLESVTIGGRLTQVQAKTVDFICSVVFAPAIIAALDYLWFSSIRVTAINERVPAAGTSLEVMTLASGIDSGTFHAVKIFNFVRTKNWSLQLFGSMLFLSAASKALFSNVIAYEAFDSPGTQPLPYTVNYLTRAVQPPNSTNESPPARVYDKYGFNSEQEASFSSRFVEMMTAVDYSASPNELLENKTYIGINATSRSLDALPQMVTELFEVPGYRLSIDCRPAVNQTPTIVKGTSYENGQRSGVATSVDISVDLENGSQDLYRSSYSGGYTEVAFASSLFPWTFVGFGWNWPRSNAHMYLGWLWTPPSPTNAPLVVGTIGVVGDGESPYGYIPAVVRNVSILPRDDSSQTNIVAVSWGLFCNVSRQTGVHNLTRVDPSTWRISSSRFDGKIDLPQLLDLSQFGYVPNFRSQRSTVPGVGASFYRTVPDPVGSIPDYEPTVLNALFGIGETERIVNEVAMSGNHSDYTYSVQGAAKVQMYRMTYVPLLVLLGLLSCFFASAIPLGLIIWHWSINTESVRKWRRVNGTRLVVDAINGLRQEQDFHNLREADNSKLRDWSKKYYVRYREDVHHVRRQIMLEKTFEQD